jgi:hypothetical protein
MHIPVPSHKQMVFHVGEYIAIAIDAIRECEFLRMNPSKKVFRLLHLYAIACCAGAVGVGVNLINHVSTDYNQKIL